MVCLTLLLNLSPTVARAMWEIPVLGKLCRVVALREYHFADEIKFIDARIPQMENWGISEQIVCGRTADLFRHPCRMKNRKYTKYSAVFHSFV